MKDPSQKKWKKYHAYHIIFFRLSEKKMEGEKNASSITNKVKQISVIILGDGMILASKRHGNLQKIKLEMQNIHETFFKWKKQLYEGLHESFIKTKSSTFYLKLWDKWVERPPEIISKSIVGIFSTLQSDWFDVSALNTIVQTDNTRLNKRASEVNCYLVKLCKERNLYHI